MSKGSCRERGVEGRAAAVSKTPQIRMPKYVGQPLRLRTAC